MVCGWLLAAFWDKRPAYLSACLLPLQTRARGEMSFNIDGHHMYEFDRTLYNWAVTYPAETGELILVICLDHEGLLASRR